MHIPPIPAVENADPEIARLVQDEARRQYEKARLIPSENYVSVAVLEASGSVLTNKYAEGYPGRRYYEGQQFIDPVEIIARDRAAIAAATDVMRFAAGNFYINDKPTGAVVGQQPFGGSRASGTNDKAGSPLNLYRWISPRAIKETFVPPRSVGYPFMEAE